MVEFPELIGRSGTELCTLETEAAKIELAQVARMLDAAREDWPGYLTISEPVDIRWVDAFDTYYDKSRVKDLVKRSSPDDFGNDYVVIACEFGAVLGHVLKQHLPRLQWIAGNPYWESALFDPESGNIVAVFHWAIKKLSSYGIDDGFAAKVQACLDVLQGGAAAG